MNSPLMLLPTSLVTLQLTNGDSFDMFIEGVDWENSYRKVVVCHPYQITSDTDKKIFKIETNEVYTIPIDKIVYQLEKIDLLDSIFTKNENGEYDPSLSEYEIDSGTMEYIIKLKDMYKEKAIAKAKEMREKFEKHANEKKKKKK